MARGVNDWQNGAGGGGGDPPARVPVVNAPPIVSLLIVVLLAAFFLSAVLPPSLKALVYYYGSVSPPRILHGEGGLASLASFPAHILLHDGILHVGLNSVWLLAFGAPVARRMGADAPPPLRRRPALAFAGLFLCSAIAGALGFIAMHPAEISYLMGASGGVSGLLGALVRFAIRAPTSRRAPQEMSGLLDPPVLVWSAAIIGLNVFIGLFSATVGLGDAKIAWEAHVGGFLFGLFAFPAFMRLAAGRRA